MSTVKWEHAVQNNSSVIVIGGGLAGLCAAYELQRAGISTHIIEASDRIGGRVLSVSYGNGDFFDLGGELISPHHTRWIAYAREFELHLTDSGFYAGLPSVCVEGKTLSSDAVDTLDSELARACEALTDDARKVDPQRPWLSVDAERLDDTSVAAWIASLRVSDLTKRVLTSELETGNGAPAATQSYLALLAQVAGGGLEAFWEDTARLRCQQGAQKLADCFAGRIGLENVTLQMPVVAIEKRGSLFAVESEDGCVRHGTDVVVAVPPRGIAAMRMPFDVTPPCTLQMGSAIKALANAEQPFQTSPRGYGDGPLSTAWTLSEFSGQRTMACLSGGPAADALRKGRSAAENIEEGLRAFFPDSGTMQVCDVQDWDKAPWIGGGYTFPAVGQIIRMRDFWERPMGGFYFCGEHTDYAFVGFMEGALRSGARVAQTIIERRNSGK